MQRQKTSPIVIGILFVVVPVMVYLLNRVHPIGDPFLPHLEVTNETSEAFRIYSFLDKEPSILKLEGSVCSYLETAHCQTLDVELHSQSQYHWQIKTLEDKLVKDIIVSQKELYGRLKHYSSGRGGYDAFEVTITDADIKDIFPKK